MTEPRIPSLGEEVEGTLLRPDLVQVMGMIHAEGYAVAIKLLPAPEDEESEPLTIMVALEHVPTLMRMILQACDELKAGMTAPRS